MSGTTPPNRRRTLLRLATGLLTGLPVGPALASGTAALVWRDLGGFWLRLPPFMQQHAGGVDSRAGQLVGGGLRIDYDLGVYADPLTPRAGALDRAQAAVVVDGLPAHVVRWRTLEPAPGRYLIGLHLPQIRPTVMGPLRLTLLAYGSDAELVERARPMLLSLRLSAPPALP